MKKRDKDLSAIRESLMARAMMEQVEGKDVWDVQRKALARIDGFPVKRILDMIQYLQDQILPGVQKRSGKDSQEFILFSELVDALLWSLAVDDRREYLTRKIGVLQLERQILSDRVILAENELLKYQTAEELLYSDALTTYLQKAKTRVDDLKKTGKK